jgi:curved DNA-binding protein CbpA
MSFQIERGLFLLEFSDHHAILGVPVDAATKDIRKRYLKIARRLHPDSCVSETEEGKQRASQFLSRLVNPSWEKLSQEKERTEYELMLKLKGQQASRQSSSLELHSNLAKQLLTAGNPEHFYHTALKDLADKQYEQLDQTLEVTAQLSELNMVYLIRKEGKGDTKGDSKRPIYTGSNLPDSSQSGGRPSTGSSAPPAKRETLTDQYYRRAETHFSRGNYAQAVLELREALQIDPKHSRCHSLLGMVYLKQNQSTMAKIHFNKALEFDSQNPMALEGRQKLEQASKSTNPTTSSPKATTQTTNPKSNDQSGGGLFGLFGGKKK